LPHKPDNLPLKRVATLALLLPVRPARSMNRLDPVSPHRPRASSPACWVISVAWSAVLYVAACMAIAMEGLSASEGLLGWGADTLELLLEPVKLILELRFEELLLYLTFMGLMVLLWQATPLLLAIVSLAWLPTGGRLTERTLAGLRRWWLMCGLGLWPWLVWGMPAAALNYIVEVLRAAPDFSWADSPWLLRYEEQIGVTLFALSALLTACLVHWALSAGRPGPRCAWPPLCRVCGYQLLGLSKAQTCPECGEPVAASQSDQRDGPAKALWRRGGVLVWPALLWLGPVFRPTAWAARLRRISPDPAWRKALIIHACSAPLIGVALGLFMGCVHLVLRWMDGSKFADFESEFLWVGLITGALWGGAMLGLTILSASVVGAVLSAIYKRNLLRAAAQAGAYLAGWANMVLVVFWLWAFGIMVIEETDALDRIVGPANTPTSIAVAITIVLGMLAILLLPVVLTYLWCLVRMTRAMRYSNR